MFYNTQGYSVSQTEVYRTHLQGFYFLVSFGDIHPTSRNLGHRTATTEPSTHWISELAFAFVFTNTQPLPKYSTLIITDS